MNLSPITFPVDYDAKRKALVDEIQKVTRLTCIVAEPETQNEPRPPKPYFTMKMINPGIKKGDDSADNTPNTSIWNRGGNRKMVVDFNCYGRSHEEAYNYMALWQSALELETIETDLSAKGIAVWLNGSVADLSALLNTGYEGRSQMHVEFGIAANLTEDVGNIHTINVGTGTVSNDDGSVNVSVNVQVIDPN